MMKEAVEDLTTTLNEAASAVGVVGCMVESITQAINQDRGVRRGPGQGWGWRRERVSQTLQGLWAVAEARLLMFSCSWMRGQWVSQRGPLWTTRP